MVSGEPDYTKRMKGKIDHWWIKSVELKDPTFSACLPCSIENDAIAYDAANDRFKVAIEDATGVTFTTDITDDWTRLLGQIDLARVAGAAIDVTNPVPIRISDGSAFIDPRDRNWTITEALDRAWNLDKTTDGVAAKIDENILGFQFLASEPTALTSDTPNLYARVDAYKRLLVNAAVVANPPNLDVPISNTLDRNALVKKDTAQPLSSYSLDASSSHNVDITVPSGRAGVAFALRAAYDASATAGVTIKVYWSFDGTNYDTDTDDSYTHPFAAGATKQKTYIAAAIAPYIRLTITNQDATYAVTLDLWRTFI
ncbi:MAG: hypothetical protein DRJ03_09355 [Chloroflexi bacterium]|nr:MAG: hypothetical protein DRJ03_09355 [Chloroflexota bacterium]